MSLSLRYAAHSHVGLMRDGNEDSGYAGPHVLAVADGMGGHVAGEVASSIAVATAAAQDTDLATPHPGDNGLDATIPALPLREDDLSYDQGEAEQPVHQHMARRLHHIITGANERIRQRVEAQHMLRGMGTTLTVLMRTEEQLGLAHVGDSRCYRLSQGHLEQMTTDHTFVQALVDEGRITASQAAIHPQRSLITRALDGREDVEPDITFHPLRKGDRYLLCSDGLSGVVSAPGLQEVLLNEPDLNEACEELIARALEGGGPDNITCIVVDVVASKVRQPPVLWVGAAQSGRHLSGVVDATMAMPALGDPALKEVSQRRSWGFRRSGRSQPAGAQHGLPAPVDSEATTGLPPYEAANITRSSQADTEVLPPVAADRVGQLPEDATDLPTVTSLRSRFSRREPDSKWPWWVLSAAFVCALSFLLASLAYADSQRRYFIGVTTVSAATEGVLETEGMGAGGEGSQPGEPVVAIYQGVDKDIPLVTLMRLNETIQLPLSALPPITRERVRNTIPARDAQEAQQIVGDLRQVAALCEPWAKLARDQQEQTEQLNPDASQPNPPAPDAPGSPQPTTTDSTSAAPPEGSVEGSQQPNDPTDAAQTPQPQPHQQLTPQQQSDLLGPMPPECSGMGVRS